MINNIRRIIFEFISPIFIASLFVLYAFIKANRHNPSSGISDYAGMLYLYAIILFFTFIVSFAFCAFYVFIMELSFFAGSHKIPIIPFILSSMLGFGFGSTLDHTIVRLEGMPYAIIGVSTGSIVSLIVLVSPWFTPRKSLNLDNSID